MPNPSPVLDKNCAPMGTEFLSSTGARVWRKAPKAFPDSSSVLDKFQSANSFFTKKNGSKPGDAQVHTHECALTCMPTREPTRVATRVDFSGFQPFPEGPTIKKIQSRSKFSVHQRIREYLLRSPRGSTRAGRSKKEPGTEGGGREGSNTYAGPFPLHVSEAPWERSKFSISIEIFNLARKVQSRRLDSPQKIGPRRVARSAFSISIEIARNLEFF